MAAGRDMGQNAPANGGWLLALIASCVTGVALGLALVWVNIEGRDMGREVHTLKAALDKREAHNAQLEVERERICSPAALHRKAAEFGMHAASPGQIRRMDNGTLDTLPQVRQ